MKLEKLERVRVLLNQAKTLRTLPDVHRNIAAETNCDKHDFKFGGDSRFAVFKADVHLTSYKGYYGNSSCSTVGGIDNRDAADLLNEALNIHRNLILSTMADIAERKAQQIKGEAEVEIKVAQDLLASILSEVSTKGAA